MVALGRGDGTFDEQRTTSLDAASDVAAADLNGDGRQDLVVSSFDSGRVTVLLGRPDGFSVTRRLGVPYGVHDLAIGNVDGDAAADLVVGFVDSGSVGILLGHGDGAFDAAVAVPNGPLACDVPDVRGNTLVRAKRLLRSHGCRVGPVRPAPSSQAKKGHVLRQRPRPGARVPIGTRVELVVGRGP